MKTITWTELRDFRAQGLLGQMPIYITVDGTVKAVLANPQDCIMLCDLHPRVQLQIKAHVARASAGQEQTRLEVPAV